MLEVTIYDVAIDVSEQVNTFMEYVKENGLDLSEVQDTLDAIQGELADKAEGLVKSIRNYEADAAAKKNEAERLVEAAKADLAKADNLAKFLDSALKVSGVKSLHAGVFSLKYKKGSKITEVDVNKLPKKYWVTVPATEKPMPKPELKKLLDAGKQIEGVRIVQNPDVLVIK